MQVPGIPRYVRIREALRQRIDDGAYRAGEKIPSEHVLAKEFGVSRMTVRRALRQLTDAGMLVRRPGSGTYVQHRFVSYSNRLRSYSDEVLAQGFEPSARVLFVGIRAASPSVAAGLQIPEGEDTICIERLRLADGTPIAFSRVHVRRSLFPELAHRADWDNYSLYAHYEKRGLPPAYAHDRVEARCADEEQAQILGIAAGDPVLYGRRELFSPEGVPIEFGEGIARGDRFAYEVEVYRSPQ